jgi:hypothetical protein
MRFIALLFTALALAPAMAHLLELPNKISLPREDYLTVQQIYRGWALLGFVVVGALLANQATNNWTVLPENWLQLRSQWEYSHAASAVLNLIALIALIGSVLARDE